MVHQNQFILRAGEVYPSRDSYEGMEIDHGVLRINFDFVRGFQTYKFRWQKGDFYLIGASSDWRWANASEEWDINFSTRRSVHTWTRRHNLPFPVFFFTVAWTSSKFFI